MYPSSASSAFFVSTTRVGGAKLGFWSSGRQQKLFQTWVDKKRTDRKLWICARPGTARVIKNNNA